MKGVHFLKDDKDNPISSPITAEDLFCDEAETACSTSFWVGDYREFEAIKLISKIEGVICASRVSEGGGSPVERLVNIPAGSISSSMTNVSQKEVADKIVGLLSSSLEIDHSYFGAPIALSQGTTYSIKVLAPNKHLKFSRRNGVWYYVDSVAYISSDNLGDFSDFVKTKNCGYVLPVQINFSQIDYSVKKQNHNLAMQFLIKENYKNNYLKLLACE